MAGLTLVLNLTCSTTRECVDVDLTLKSIPSVGLDLKREIELAQEIPVFTQTLTYGTGESCSAEITDDDAITNAVLRHGDRLKVSYTSKAECKDVQSVVVYLEKLTASFRQQFPTANDASPSAVLLNQAFSGGIAHLLRNDLFLPWRSSVKQMNQEVFLRAGGLNFIIQLLQHVQASDWSTSIRNFKLLEIFLLGTLDPLAATFKFRRLLVQKGVVELCLKGLLRHKLERRAAMEDELTRFLLGEAATALCNLCEVHETHVSVGSNREALEQLICIAHSAHYDHRYAVVVLSLMVCLAHSTEVHPHLASDDIVGGIVDICAFRRECADSSEIELTLLRYYAQLVFIQLILLSPLHLSKQSLEKLDSFMAEFLRDVGLLALAKQEQTSGTFWSVFEPFVSLLYVPKAPLAKRGVGKQIHLLERLWFSSVHSALIAISVIISNFTDGHKSLELMQRENVVPFVILAPSHVPTSLKPQATEVVRCLGRHIPINPPTLSDLAKASLATYQFGLKRMLHLVSPHELVDEYCIV